MKSLFKTVALITIFSFLTRLTGFIFRIILSREVGAEGVGLYQVAFSVFMVLLTVLSSGIPLIISRMTSAYSASKDKKRESSLVAVALIYTLAISIFLCLIVLIFRSVFTSIFTDARCFQILISLLPALVFSSVYCVLRGAMWGKGNYFALCITEFYEQIVRIVVAVLMISSSLTAIENALNLGWSMSIACLFSMIFVIILFFYYDGKLGKLKKEYFKPLVKQSTPITLMRVAGSFIQPLIALIVPARLMTIGYTSSQALSMYGVAVGMTLPLLFITTSIIGSLSTALVPDMSRAKAQNDNDHINERIKKSIMFALLISALFVPIFLGMGEIIGVFLYDDILSGTLLQSACWIVIPLGLTNISSALLNSLGYESKSFINFIIGAIFMFAALWILPTIFGINAVIWAMGIDYTITAVLNILLLKKKTSAHLKLAPLLIKIILLLIPISALTAFATSLSSFVFPAFITIFIGAAVSVSSSLLLANVFNIFDFKTIVMYAKSKFKPKAKIKAKT